MGKRDTEGYTPKISLSTNGCVVVHETGKFVAKNEFRFRTTMSDPGGGGEIAQSLAFLSMKRVARVRSWLDPLVTEKWNSISVLLTCSHQCRRLVKKRQSMCYYVCVIMHVKDPIYLS